MSAKASIYALVREAVLNTTSSPIRTGLTAAVSVLIGAVVVISTVTNVDNIALAHKTQELRGLSTLSVTSTEGQPLSASGCDSLRGITAVKAAGGGIRTEHIQPPNSPATVTVRYVTPGYFAIAFPGEEVNGLMTIAGKDLGEELGLVVGAYVIDAVAPSRSDAVPIYSVASTTARIDGMNRDILIATPPSGEMAECLVEAAHGQTEIVAGLIPAHFSSPVAVRPFLPASSVDRDPVSELQHRWSGFIWLGGGLGIVLFTSYIWWSRRDETALYRLLGFSTRSIGVVVVLETLIVSAIPAQLSIAWALAITPTEGGTVTIAAVLADTSRFALLLLLAPVFAVVISATGSIVDRLKGL